MNREDRESFCGVMMLKYVSDDLQDRFLSQCKTMGRETNTFWPNLRHNCTVSKPSAVKGAWYEIDLRHLRQNKTKKKFTGIN